jgi:phage shock protein E
MSFLKRLFGVQSVDLKVLKDQGALILDVRTPSEFKSGHIKGAVNVPLQVLDQQLTKLDKNETIITCCASGMRSGSAKNLLQSNGFVVHNGGGWQSLQRKLA